MEESLNQYILIAAFGAIALGFACIPLILASLLSPSKPGEIKDATYECGLEAKGNPWGKFKVQYYIYALVFVIFDVEAVFIFPWATAFLGISFGGFLAMAVFILILAESLAYLWIKGVLEWR